MLTGVVVLILEYGGLKHCEWTLVDVDDWIWLQLSSIVIIDKRYSEQWISITMYVAL